MISTKKLTLLSVTLVMGIVVMQKINAFLPAVEDVARTAVGTAANVAADFTEPVYYGPGYGPGYYESAPVPVMTYPEEPTEVMETTEETPEEGTVSIQPVGSMTKNVEDVGY